MTTSDLKMLLHQNIDVQKFRESIQDEVVNYRNQLVKHGTSSPVIVEEDTTFCFNQEHLVYLTYLLKNNSLSGIEVSYMADAITLTDSIEVETDELFDAVEILIINTLT